MKRSFNRRGFKALLVTLFLGAFNDNAFKLVVSLFVLNLFVGKYEGTEYLSFPTAVFILPFLLFSLYAGYLADKISKYKVIIGTKFLELIVMCFGFLALATANIWIILAVLFLMGLQSTFFGPAKYGILPELLDDRDLSEGNGALQLWTYLAIIFGTAFGGFLYYLTKEKPQLSCFAFIAVSVIGIIASFFVTKVKPSGSTRKFQPNFPLEIFHNLKRIKRMGKAIWLSLLGLAYFGLLASVFQLNILLYARKIMTINELYTGLLLTILALGVGLGSVAAGKVSAKKIEFGFVPLGAIGLSVLSIILGFTHFSFIATAICLFILGLSAGFYIVPLNTYIQQRSPSGRRGQILATLNFFSFFAILSGTGVIYALREWLKLNAAQIFIFSGACTILATLYILKILPVSFVRLLNWFITHSLYKIKVTGADNVPKEGGALLICNHVSFVDPLVVLGSIQRPIRFLMNRRMYKLKAFNFICRLMKVIPISFSDSPRTMFKSLQEARQAVKNGEIVCVFAEGQLSRTGNMQAFNKGFEYIMKGVDAPIIPIYVDRIWGSIFSFERGKYIWKKPKAIPYPLTVSFGNPMPAKSKAYEVRQAVLELSADAFKLRGKDQKKLHMAFIDEVKSHPFKFCMADSTNMKLNYLQVLTTILLVSKKIFPKDKEKTEKEKVGILLPASCMASVANGASLFAGKVPVNLNFTASEENLDFSIKECAIKKIITSKKFLEKAKINFNKENKDIVFLEDLKNNISGFEKAIMFAAALFLPRSLIKMFFVRGDKYNIDDLATVIFSSGSTGRPKGVMLSHGNIFSNIEGFYQVMGLDSEDIIMGVLPFFHSFGFTATLCLPPGSGIGVVYHSNPLDAKMVGRLVKEYGATILLGTPTFFSAYIRKCKPEQFRSIHYALAGAEKLKKNIADKFSDKFGTVPFEGYGATELSPIVSLGVPDEVSNGAEKKQAGYKPGKVGQPIPGVAVKIVDPDTYRLLPYNEEGLMLVKGPNVMKGYLNQPEKTKEVIKGGWYITGDIAFMDQDGFIQITDRLSRFSKIGGEMVPHVKIEEEILKILGTTEPVCVVTSVADQKKGERLVVLYKGDVDIEQLCNKLSESGMPNLWIPKKNSFYKIDEIPLLGSGKLDLKQIRKLAQDIANIDN